MILRPHNSSWIQFCLKTLAKNILFEFKKTIDIKYQGIREAAFLTEYP